MKKASKVIHQHLPSLLKKIFPKNELLACSCTVPSQFTLLIFFEDKIYKNVPTTYSQLLCSCLSHLKTLPQVENWSNLLSQLQKWPHTFVFLGLPSTLTSSAPAAINSAGKKKINTLAEEEGFPPHYLGALLLRPDTFWGFGPRIYEPLNLMRRRERERERNPIHLQHHFLPILPHFYPLASAKSQKTGERKQAWKNSWACCTVRMCGVLFTELPKFTKYGFYKNHSRFAA